MKRMGPTALLASILLVALEASAVAPKSFDVRSQKDWLEGEAKGLEITPRGELEPGPEIAAAVAIEEAVLWSVAAGPDGAAWIGTGSGGALYHLSAAGELKLATTFPELQVTALLADGDGVLAATAPEGAVYRVRAGGEVVELGRPQAQYLWCLARGSDGAIYAGSGVEGKIWRIAEGKTEEWYRAPDLHVVSLTALADGVLVAGTAERGLVLRVAGGQGSVLHDSSMKEVRALLASASGDIIAAVNGGASFRDAGAPPRPGEAAVTVSAAAPSAEASASAQAMVLPPPETLGDLSAEIVRLRGDGSVEYLARTKGELVYALAEGPRGELLAGTARRLLVPVAGEEPAVIGLSDGGQVSALARDGADVLLATTAPSRILRLKTARAGEGSWVSKVFAADGDARWGQLRWDADLPAGASLLVETRAGGSAEPDTTWSEWSKPMSEPGAVASPAGRYIQVRLRLTSPGAAGARVRSLALSYLPRNLPPMIRSIKAEPPGVVFQKASQGGNVVEAVPPPLPSMFDELGPPRAEAMANAKRLYLRGAQTLSWEVGDPNDDAIRLRLFVQPRAGGRELLLADPPESSPLTFDTEALPDGWWIARLEVDDTPANGAGTGLQSSRRSDAFLVDNTPPSLSLVGEPRCGGGRLRAELRARDALSGLWKAEWSLDGAPFVPLAAQDGITDGVEERFELSVDSLPRGKHLAIVRVTDLANMSTVLAIPCEGGGSSSADTP